MNRSTLFAFAAAFTCGPALCVAQPHEGDILLSIVDGRIATGGIDEAGSIDPDVRVFQTRLGEVAPNFTSEPGFECAVGTFPPGSRNGLRVQRAVRWWDGSDFDAISPSRFEIAYATLATLTPETDTIVEGFTLAVGTNGQWHRHLDYTILAPASPGVYLLEVTLFSTLPDIAESAAFWLVFNQDAPQSEADAATQWVRDHLIAAPCIADFNRDGGVDGGDVEAFFLSWEAGGADVNQDGGVDGGDVEFFFLRWEAGGCD